MIVVVGRSSCRLPFVYNMAPCVLKRLLPKPDGFDEIQNDRNNEAKRRHLLDIDEGEQEEKRRRIQEQGRERFQRHYRRSNRHCDSHMTSEDELEMARAR
jgi:hypothetical protein